MKNTLNMAQTDTFNKKNAFGKRQENIRVFSRVKHMHELVIHCLIHNY